MKTILVAAFLTLVAFACGETKAAELIATWDSPSAVPVTATGYHATGSSIDLRLSFTPVVATDLVVVNNTGSGFIEGTFSNLTHGQHVELSFDGVAYPFVANYFGGSGNDLVLHWALVRPVAWGVNSNGQLGDGSLASRNVPASVRQDGVLAGKTIVSLASGSYHHLALCSDGTLVSWGRNFQGQLGNFSLTDSPLPVGVVQNTGVLAGKRVIAMAAGASHSLVLCSDGTLAAWGGNYSGELGTGDGRNSAVPVAVVQDRGVLAGKTVVAIVCGDGHSLALCSDGTLASWGRNLYGQLGDGTNTNRAMPVSVVQATGALFGKVVTSMAAGFDFNLVVCSDGRVISWGLNNHDQLGHSAYYSVNLPQSVRSFTGALSGKSILSVAAATSHSLALCSDGTLAAWGGNRWGELGIGTTASTSNLVAVLQNSGPLAQRTVSSLKTGNSHNLVLCTDGTMVGWGKNSLGELGDGTYSNTSSPESMVATTSFATRERFHLIGRGKSDDSTVALVAAAPPLHVAVIANDVEIISSDNTPSAADNTEFGNVAAAGGVVTRTYTIRNRATRAVPLGSVSISGVHAADFRVVSQPASNLDPGASTSFQITFDPGSYGLRGARVGFIYDNRGQSPYEFEIQGTSVTSPPTGISLSSTTLSENNLPEAIVATLTAMDADPADVHSFSLAPGEGGEDNENFYILGSNLHLKATADFEAKSTYSIRIRADDGQGGVFEHPFTILIHDDLEVPTLSGPTARSDTATTAEAGGDVTFDGGLPVIERGVVYSLSSVNTVPSLGDSGVTRITAQGSSGPFMVSITGLTPNSTYSFRTYATNAMGTAYSSVGNFHTVFSFAYMTPGDAPFVATTFNAANRGVSLSLGFLPVPGTNLTVVNNTGMALIRGEFNGLEQGQRVRLGFRSVLYDFVVNYYGGDGNDMVLQWANVRPIAWGANNAGQLGNNSTVKTYTPVAVLQNGVLAGKTVTSVVTGGAHSMALCSDGTVAAWGASSSGQLGIDSAIDRRSPVLGPINSGALVGKRVIALAAGGSHSLALCSDGTLAAWGRNDERQLGNGGSTSSHIPVAVVQNTGALEGKEIVSIAAGDAFSMALCSDGTIATWGLNVEGQLGVSGSIFVSVPVAVPRTSGVLLGKQVVQISAGGSHALALCSDGTVAAWGSGFYGQLGNGENSTKRTPVGVMQNTGVLAGKTVIRIAAGSAHSVALCSDRTMVAWGLNSSGQLGNNSSTNSNVPVAVIQDSGDLAGKSVLGVWAGGIHNAVLCSDGACVLWGNSSFGQAGVDFLQPVRVPKLMSSAFLGPGERLYSVNSHSSASFNLALVAMMPSPEITLTGNGLDIAPGDNTPDLLDFTDLGAVTTARGSIVRTFTILNSSPSNAGGFPLTLSNITVGGRDTYDFSVFVQPSQSVEMDGSTTFEVTFNPTVRGLRTATLSFQYNDREAPFQFSIQGTGLNSVPTAIYLVSPRVVENNSPNVLVGTLSWVDADYEDTPTFSLVEGEGGADNESFTVSGNTLRFLPRSDFETQSTYSIRLRVTDGQGGAYETPMTVWITDVLEAPVLGPPQVTNLSATEASLGGEVLFDGGSPILKRGVIYSATGVNADPVIDGGGVTNVEIEGATGSYSRAVSGLSPEMSYSFRAYAINATGVAYSQVATFRTSLAFTYTGAGSIPVVASYFVAGGPVTVALGYAPVAGTNLVVVKNTGRDLIHGSFGNLVHGQVVLLPFGGLIYEFHANYFGGDGNDLVLQWARVRPMAWGDGTSAQLGNNLRVSSPTPVPVRTSGVLSGKTVVSLAKGIRHTLALCSDGSLVTWGENLEGQLGNNTRTTAAVPVQVAQGIGVLAGKRVIAVAAGDYHNLVLCADGTLAAWGNNLKGQLGNNSTERSLVPVEIRREGGVLAGKSVVAISAGGNFNVALCTDGTLAAWGENDYGQLGNNRTTDSLVPVAVRQISGPLVEKSVVAIAAGADHCIALCSDGMLVGWGRNDSGQLGNSSSVSSPSPVAVRQSSGALLGKTVVAIAAGSRHSLALSADGTIAAWGAGSFGQLGNGGYSSTVPVAVNQGGDPLAGKTVVAIAAGNDCSLAVCSDGGIAAWGNNGQGRLGDNTLQSSATPVAVNRTALAAGAGFTLARQGAAAQFTVALSAEPPAPAIAISGNGVPIDSGDSQPGTADGTDFGPVMLSNADVKRTFTLANPGDAPLSLMNEPRVTIEGEAAADFHVNVQPPSNVAPRTASRFEIAFDPTLPGVRAAIVTVTSNDPQKPRHTFYIQGFGKLITPQAQVITSQAPTTLFAGDAPLHVQVTASSGLPVSLSLVSGPAGTTLDEDYRLTFPATGVIKLRATQTGGGNFAAATPLILALEVKRRPSSLTLTNLEQIYDGSGKAVGVEGAQGAVEIAYTVNGTTTSVPPVNAGVYSVVAVAGADTKTGKLVIKKAPLVITPVSQRRFVGQDNAPLTATYSSLGVVLDASVLSKPCVITTTAQRSSPAGIFPIRVSGGAAPNHTLVYVAGSLTVDGFSGGYEALLVNSESRPLGKLSLTVPSAGKTFTGKMQLADELAVLPVAGSLVTDFVSAKAAGSATTQLKGSSVSYTLTFTLPLYGDVVCSVERDGSTIASSTSGRKTLVLPAGGKVGHAGSHTVILEPGVPGGPTVPGGAGWATATISPAGQLTLTGRLGDGTPFTSSLSPDGDLNPGYRMFVQPYLPARVQSYLGGEFHLLPHPDTLLSGRRYVEAASMTWRKNGLAKDAAYRAGFGPVRTVLTLDPWLAPTAKSPLPALLGLPGTEFHLFHSPSLGAPHDDKLPSSVALAAGNVFKVLQPTANVTKWKATLAPSTGTFAGSFELVEEGAAKVKRVVPFTGVLRQPPVRPATEGVVLGDGHFVLPPLSGTEKITGGVSLTPP